MAKKVINIGTSGVRESVQGSGPITSLEVNYPNGQQDSNAGKSLYDRAQLPAVTSKGGPFNGFAARFATIDGSNNFGLQSHTLGAIYDCVLFTPDWPTSLYGQASLANDAYQGATLVFEDPYKLNIDAGITAQANAGAAFTQVPDAKVPTGKIAKFTSSEGVTFWGYNVVCNLRTYGLTKSDLGALSASDVYLQAFAGGNGIAGPEFVFSAGLDSGGTVLVREDQLRADMLSNPYVDCRVGGTRFRAAVAGVYSVR